MYSLVMSEKRLFQDKEKNLFIGLLDSLWHQCRNMYYLRYLFHSLESLERWLVERFILVVMNGLFCCWSSNIYLKLCGKVRVLCLFNKWYKGAKYHKLEVILKKNCGMYHCSSSVIVNFFRDKYMPQLELSV